MKTTFVLVVLATLAFHGANANAKEMLQGSDTMAGVMTDAIIAAGMDSTIGYAGGGSGNGETALVNGEQGIAPMSREVKAEAAAKLNQKGVTVVPHVVGLDGVGIFVNAKNPMPGLSIDQIRDIFTCKLVSWDQVTGAKERGAIHAFRRNDKSGTTDTIKNLVGIKDFGACVTVVEETADIAAHTGNDAAAVGYAGLSAKTDKNAVLAISKKAGDAYVIPTAATVRAKTYPLSRRLFVYEVSGSAKPSSVEAKLLEKLLDRSFLDPIIQSNEFFTID
jgi:phosphate transport system substrate-binding protein